MTCTQCLLLSPPFSSIDLVSIRIVFGGVCVYVWVYTQRHMCVSTAAWVFETLTGTWGPLICPDWLPNKPWEPACVCFPSTTLKACTRTAPSFLYGCRGLNSGTHACIVSILSTELNLPHNSQGPAFGRHENCLEASKVILLWLGVRWFYDLDLDQTLFS